MGWGARRPSRHTLPGQGFGPRLGSSQDFVRLEPTLLSRGSTGGGTMGHWRAGGGHGGDSARRVLLGRLIRNLLDYSQRFLDRHGLNTVAISVQFHEGRVVWVTHANCTRFPAAGPLGSNCRISAGAPDGSDPGSRARAMTPDELNARIGLRVHRLVRHFGIRFGLLQIQVEGGKIITIQPSPPFRPAELRKLADPGDDDEDDNDNDGDIEDRRVA